jgi:MYXO-CTERM domain-containing protein
MLVNLLLALYVSTSAHATTLSTTAYAGSDNGAGGAAFAVGATNDVDITGLQVYTFSASSSCAYLAYATTSALGAPTDLATVVSTPSSWTEIASGTTGSVSATASATITFTSPITVSAGSYRGIYVTFTSCTMKYLTGASGSVVNSSVVASDANLSVYMGYGRSYSTSWTGSLFSPRAFYGALTYNACTPVAWYLDDDGDGYGDPTVSVSECTVPSGYVANDADCDDTSAAVNPGADEYCDAIDNDCDGSTDQPSALDASVWYVDEDSDGYGGTASTLACTEPGGYTDNDADCDDGEPTTYPGADEYCDEADNDCNGTIDDDYALDTLTWYDDDDGDSYGDAADTYDACDMPSGYAGNDTDCDDGAGSVYPGAPETVADGTDQDCDSVDSCYTDADGDNQGTSAVVDGSSLSCDTGTGAPVATDCDDLSASVYLGAPETTADGTDQDCDSVDSCYTDSDGDNYGTSVVTDGSSLDCVTGNGAANDDDCNDGDGAINPDATEIAGDLVDQDCDGVETCFVDADNDSYRPDAASTVESSNIACDADGEAVATDDVDDCDDNNAAINPGATELVGDEIDQDCDGTELCYADGDDDGYTADSAGTVSSPDLLCDSTGEATDDASDGDCDDGSAAYNPGADESDCTDPNDYNCDGSVGYADGDADGFAACEECDDALAAVNPDADELCNGIDDDCDGTVDVGAVDATTWYADADGDGYASGDDTLTGCEQPDGYVTDATDEDCDDGDAAINPEGEEVPGDGIDQDCDGADGTDTGGDDNIDDTGDTTDKGGCNCSSTGDTGATLSLLFGVIALAASRRRR